jgi:hypothetical protein
VVLARRAHAEQAVVAAAAHREHEVAPDEDVHLADVELVQRIELQHLHDDEQRGAVLLDLGAMVASSVSLASLSATQTKQSGFWMYTLMSSTGMSESFLPS